MTQFDATISSRIRDVRKALEEARADGEDYLADVHLGELESLARVAADHGVLVEGVEETLEAYGVPTPAAGVHRIDLAQGSARPVDA